MTTCPKCGDERNHESVLHQGLSFCYICNCNWDEKSRVELTRLRAALAKKEAEISELTARRDRFEELYKSACEISEQRRVELVKSNEAIEYWKQQFRDISEFHTRGACK